MMTSFDGGRSMQQQQQQQAVLPHPTQHSPSIMQVSFPKGSSGIGLSIVATRIPAQDKLGIFVKSVVKGGAADADGRVQSGDQLLKVNGKSLVNVNQERAAELIGQSGKTVHLDVLKQGAFINGLATIINDSQIPPPSPAPVRVPKFYVQNGERVPIPVNGHGEMKAQESQLPPDGHETPPPEGSYPHHHPHHHQVSQPQAQRQQWVAQEVKAVPPPAPDIQRKTLQHRPPSPIRETIAAQMQGQRDKMRQDAKMMEMEDELRRRRQHLYDEQHSPTRSPIAPHTLNHQRRSVSQERLDNTSSSSSREVKGTRPVEKRVQWAVDSPKKSPSPTAMQLNVIPNKAVRFEDAKTVTTNGNRQLTNDSGDIRKNAVNRESSSSPSSSPWLRAEHEEMQRWRQSEARRFRDQDITSLQSRQDELTAVESERLRTLLLERDFQHRAEQGPDDGSEEDDEEEEDQAQEHYPVRYRDEHRFVSLSKPSPHLHHPVAAVSPDVYRTPQQDNYDRFVEYNAVNEAIKRSREHLDSHQALSIRPLPSSPPQPNGYLHSLQEAASYGKRLTAGAEIRQEVENSASVVGNHEVYNDPRSKILNAKVLRLPPPDNDTSPEKLSFGDKMKMFAISMGDQPNRDRLLANSRQTGRQREIDYGSS